MVSSPYGPLEYIMVIYEVGKNVVVGAGVLGALADSADHVNHVISHEITFDARRFGNWAKYAHKCGKRTA